MTDLVEKLNNHANLLAMVDKEVRPQQSTLASQQLMRKAADAIERLDLAYLRVIGWRERDWPEGFDRRTADLIAEYAREAMEEKP